MDAGVRMMLLSSFLFAFMGVFAKLSSETLPSLEVVFFRNLLGVLLIAATLIHAPMRQIGGRLALLIFRGVVGFAALLAFFYNIAHIPLGDAMTYSKTSPIFTAIFAWLFLQERLSWQGWLAVMIGFVGIILIAKPGELGFSKTDWLGIFSGIGAALAYTSVRELKRYYDTRAIVLAFMLTGTLAPLGLMVLASYFSSSQTWDFLIVPFIMPQGVTWLYLLAMGAFATLAQVYMTRAYGASEAGVVGAVSYSNIVFALGLGWCMGDALPDVSGLAGIVLIVIGGLLVARKSVGTKML